MLGKHAEDLLPTDVPPNVYETLAASPITDVHILGRRGPMQVRFTPLELRELGELNDVEMVLYDEDFEMDAASQRAIETNKQVFVLNRIMSAWRGKAKNPSATRRMHLHFYAKTRRDRRRRDRDHGAAVRAHQAGRRRWRDRDRRDPRACRAGGVSRGGLFRLAVAGHPVRRQARRDPQS